MNDNKTIKINPELFKFNKKKENTRKIKPHSGLSLNKNIFENKFKKKILNKIKEHKNKEINDLQKEIKIKQKEAKNEKTEDTYMKNDFNDSLEYLQKLSLEFKEKNKTLKNNNTHSNEKTNISIDLPNEIIEFNDFHPTEKNSFDLHYNVDNIVPFGCLKNGIKPCYRKWKTLKNTSHPINDTMTKKEKIKNIHKKLNYFKQSQQPSQQPSIKIHNNEIQIVKNYPENIEKNNTNFPLSLHSLKKEKEIVKIQQGGGTIDTPDIRIENSLPIQNPNPISEIPVESVKTEFKKVDIPIKQTIKKTITKKYTLGKNKLKKQVGILIKNNKTRKNILDAHKGLKSKPMFDVKKYLREHNLIKAGSNCPNDVLRKIFESAILSGEIFNKDKEMLLHNMLDGNK